MSNRRRSGRAAGAAVAAVLLGAVSSGCAPHISRTELAERIARGDAPPILDVRSDAEYREAHVPGAVHVPFYSVWTRNEEIPPHDDEALVVYCEHGPRAGLARAGLWLAGAGEVRFLEGHMLAWKQDGLPVESLESQEPFAPSSGADGAAND